MKFKKFTVFTGSLLLCLFSTSGLLGQVSSHWTITGNTLSNTGSFGSNSNFSVLFKTNNIIRGTLTNGDATGGLWGFGTTFPSAKVHISSQNAQDALRVQVNGGTRLRVHGNGGVSIGSLRVPSANNVFISTQLGVGVATPGVKLHVDGGSDASLGGGGFIVTGPVGGLNMAIDNNEIMARLNGAASDLFLNHNGGNIILNAGPNSAAGKVGLHTTAPLVEAHLVHGTGNGINHGFRIANTGSNNENWTMYVQNSNGNLQLYANNVLKGNFNDNSGVYTTVSDLRMKKDIETPEAVLPKVLQLGVKKYHFLTNAADDKKNFGLIAQEVEKIFPEVVSTQKQDDGSEIYTMDYNAFGVLAIKAIQEMQQTAKEQQQKVNTLLEQQIQVGTLLDRIEKLEAAAAGNVNLSLGDLDLVGVSLEQNQPNPMNQTTFFRYTIPPTAQAQIIVFDAITGQRIKTLIAPGTGQVETDGSDLKAGTYIYSLVVNGKLAASKHLILNK